MKELEERIVKDGKLFGTEILKVVFRGLFPARAKNMNIGRARKN